MNQFLFAILYIFTVLVIFVIFLIRHTVPRGHPLSIEIHRKAFLTTTVIGDWFQDVKSLPKEEAPQQQQEPTGWGQPNLDTANGWNAQPLAVDEPNKNSLDWIDWAFASLSPFTLQQIASRFFYHNFQSNLAREEATAPPPEPQEAEPPAPEEQQEQDVGDAWEINSDETIPGLE